jgi:hypothetical protein
METEDRVAYPRQQVRPTTSLIEPLSASTDYATQEPDDTSEDTQYSTMGQQLQQEAKFEWLEENTTGTNDDAAYEWSDPDEDHGRQIPPSQALIIIIILND